MKPLLASQLESFLDRFNFCREGEFRSFEVLDPTTFVLTYAVQDKAKEYDWITLSLLFSDVEDARLLDENKMRMANMDDGISLFYEDGKFYFSYGYSQNIRAISNATYYIITKNIKFEEGQFL